MAMQVPTVNGPKVALASPTGAQIAAPQSALFSGYLDAPKLVDPQVHIDQSTDAQLNPSAIQPGLTEGEAMLPGAQLSSVARNAGSAGADMAEIAQRVQLQTNAVVTDSAVNQAKEAALRLAYDPQQGFTSIKGWDALKRPDGKPLADEYVDKFDDAARPIMDGLQNDAQKRAFAMQANDIRTSLYGQATQHESQEFQNYNLSTAEGTVAIEKANIGLNYKDPTQVANSLERIRGATAQQGMLLGKSATWIQAQQDIATSGALVTGIKSAIDDQNFAWAQAALNTYKNDIKDPNALLEIKGVVNKEMDARIGMSAGAAAVSAVAPGLKPGNFDKLTNLVGLQEVASGKDRNPDGSIITSPKGAQGSMQVMPSTAKDPGLGMDPLPDNATDAQRAAFGKQYLGKLVQRYGGDPQKATAAYNAGFGAVDNAVKAAADPANHGKPWLSFMPAETQNYVAQITKNLNSGQGAGPLPTFADVQAKIDAMNLSPERAVHAYTEAKRRWDGLEADKKQHDEDITAQATQALVANGGQYDALPPSMKAAIPADKINGLQTFAKTQAEGGNNPTNMAVYLKLTDDSYLKSITDAQFFNMRPELSANDFQALATHRASLIKGTPGNSPGDLNTPAIKMTTDGMLQQMGINPSPSFDKDTKGAARVGAINQYVRESLLTQQQQLGRKMTDAETDVAITKLFSRDVKFQNTILGLNIGPADHRMLSMQPGDIPGDQRNLITQALKKSGVSNPSDAQIMGAYWRGQTLARR
jgi:hypothetical protein